jgi:hypothetical protein
LGGVFRGSLSAFPDYATFAAFGYAGWGHWRGVRANLSADLPEARGLPYDPIQVSAHKDALSPFERYAKGGDDPKLKDWAGKTLPAMQHHLERARALDKNRK